MSQLYFNYAYVNEEQKETKVVPNNINYTIKLIVINSDYNTEGSVVDSSETFYNKTIVSEKKSEYIQIDLSKEMSLSDIFTAFWAKWSKTCGEEGYGEPPASKFYFALQVSQTFRGNARFAGYSKTDNIFVPSFGNKTARESGGCTPKSCVNPEFYFWAVNAPDTLLKVLSYDKQLINEKQVKAASTKIDYEIQLKNYQAQLIAQSPDLILSNYNYQPDSFTKVITRLLEFQQGTLVTSLDFARNADLTQLYSLLGPVNGIDYEINSLAGLYPSINIEDGEGIPYGDGIPVLYEYFGWNFNGTTDLFAIVNKDDSSVTNYGIITRNNVEILDTRDYVGSLSGLEYFTPSDYITWGDDAGFQSNDIIECTITLTDYTEDDTNFTKSDNGFELDSVSSGLTIARGIEFGIYNSLAESEWDENISPSGTTWNSEYTDPSNYGWSNLANVSTRTFGTFYNALNGDIQSNILNLELVMYDETTDEYWTVKFTNWNAADKGGGFEYIRKLIVPTGTGKTFKDTLVWK